MTFPISRVLTATGASDAATTAINAAIDAIDTYNDVPPTVVSVSTSGTAAAYCISVVVSYVPATQA